MTIAAKPLYNCQHFLRSSANLCKLDLFRGLCSFLRRPTSSAFLLATVGPLARWDHRPRVLASFSRRDDVPWCACAISRFRLSMACSMSWWFNDTHKRTKQRNNATHLLFLARETWKKTFKESKLKVSPPKKTTMNKIVSPFGWGHNSSKFGWVFPFLPL